MKFAPAETRAKVSGALLIIMGPICNFGQFALGPRPKKELTDILVEATVQHFGIESEEEKCNLKIMFDAYAQFKMRESFIKAFSSCTKEGEQECGEERTKS